MVLLGIDLGTSSIKVSAVCVQTKQTLSSIQYPPEEVGIDAPEAGWAEQSPDQWWQHVKEAIQQLVLPEGVLILEHPAHIQFELHPQLLEIRAYGQSVFSIFAKICFAKVTNQALQWIKINSTLSLFLCITKKEMQEF